MYTILILYTELMPYNFVVVKELISRGCRVHIVLWDTNKKTPYLPPVWEGVSYYNRSSFCDKAQLWHFIVTLNPDLIWTSGWIDPLYNSVAARIRRQLHIPVVAGSDTQWRGGKQWLNVLTSPFRHQRWFSHLFISGSMQYKYARLLGFSHDRILMHNLSADVALFKQVDRRFAVGAYPRNLLYIGRFSSEKNLHRLLKAWQSLPDRRGWHLTLIGNGPLRNQLDGYPDVTILDFMLQPELLHQMERAGCFMLASTFEQWSLVLHEAAAAGLPILASSRCGAVPYFVKAGENGYVFAPDQIDSIRTVLQSFLSLSEQEWISMGLRSRELASAITPATVADALLSTLRK